MAEAYRTEFTGERVIPGLVDADLMNEHLGRYVFAARLARGKRVLDAGCGSGYGSAELDKTALSVVGVDISVDAVLYAREHFRLPNLQFEQASCTALPHPDASFDLVVAFEVIEHLRDWREFLVEVRRVLAPTGQFIVSTPNKLYYAEARNLAGPNPFHEHEFEFGEFRSELSSVFPHISLFLENHVGGVVFRPVDAGETAEVRVDGAEAKPAESHFFVAVCAHRPQTGNPTFVYVPSSANMLRERENHIAVLEGEVVEARAEIHRLNVELEQSNHWAERLNAELDQRRARIAELQDELAAEQAGARAAVERLESEIRAKTEWAEQLNAGLDAKIQELAHCVGYLRQAEKTVEERTLWAQKAQAEAEDLKAKIAMIEASRWMRLGRSVGLGPKLQERQ
ncbi:MAG: methyltransferase domain-containing protein [Bryobacteraceae bacterium]